MWCHIRIKGLLDPSWQDWFGGLEIVQEQEGSTLFSGPLEDQAALHGILVKIRGLGLDLLSFETSEAFPSEKSSQASSHSLIDPSSKEDNPLCGQAPCRLRNSDGPT